MGQIEKSNAATKDAPHAEEKGEMGCEMSCPRCVARVASNLSDCDESCEQYNSPTHTESYRDAWTLLKLKRILRNDCRRGEKR
jgi:hypothetical protein